MSNTLPPDLRVLCRKLTSLPPTQLPHALPSLINHVLHCKEPLSAPQEQKTKDKSSEASQLVHKLKASVTTLLNGRSREARFAAIGLIKAMVDVGGWEVLRGSEPWVRGLLSVVQKADPMASKELAVVTLARIYMLVHPYQTLAREIATQTLPAFITSCIALIKQSPSGNALKTPFSVVETICDAFSTLVPLYPTTFRPLSSQIRTATRSYLAPTQTDELVIPSSLTRASRRLIISLHHVAAKSGGSDEWAKLVGSLLKEFHATADQIFRAVEESWEGGNGYARSRVDLDGEPNGGSSSSDGLPAWSGVQAGADRLVGLFQYLSDCLRYPTKVPVVIPTGALVDAASRAFLIARLSPKTQSWDRALQTNAAIEREEKEELWSVIPDIHIAGLHLFQVLILRLQENSVAQVPELLDHLVRVFKSGINLPAVRMTGYSLLEDILKLAGPTLSKPSVDMLDPLLGACCRDLQQDAGHLKPEKSTTSATDPKKNSIAANADLFLKPQATAVVESFALDQHHKTAAASLLAIIPSHLPQQHLKPSLRGLVDQTAILTSNRDAMLASVMNPYKDQRGRVYPSILPHLTQQFPDDQGLEILRSNLRASGQTLANNEVPLEELPVDHEEEEDEDEEMGDSEVADKPTGPGQSEDVFKSGALSGAPQVEKALPIQSNPFGTGKAAPADDDEPRHRVASPPKRKHEGSDLAPTKRQVLDKAPPSPVSAPAASTSKAPVTEDSNDDEDDDDDDESVHLNMELEDDEEED